LSSDLNHYFAKMKRKAAANAADEAAAREAAAHEKAAEERAEAKTREAVKKEQERRAAIKKAAEHKFEEYRKKVERKIRADEKAKAHDEKIDSRIDKTIQQVAAGKAASASPLRTAAASDAAGDTHAGVSAPQSTTRPIKQGTAAHAVARVEHTGSAGASSLERTGPAQEAGAATAADTVLSKEVAAVARGKQLALGDLLGDVATVEAAAANSSSHGGEAAAANSSSHAGKSLASAGSSARSHASKALGRMQGTGEESRGGARGGAAVVAAKAHGVGMVEVMGGNTETGRQAGGAKPSLQDASHLVRNRSGDHGEARDGKTQETALQQAAVHTAKAAAEKEAAAASRATAAALGKKIDAVLTRAVSLARHAAGDSASAEAAVSRLGSAAADAAQVLRGGGVSASHAAAAAVGATSGAAAAGAGAGVPSVASLQVTDIDVFGRVDICLVRFRGLGFGCRQWHCCM
jgi:hypothetical protein